MCEMRKMCEADWDSNGWDNWETYRFIEHYLDPLIDEALAIPGVQFYRFHEYEDFVQSHIDSIYNELFKVANQIKNPLLIELADIALRSIDVREVADVIMREVVCEFKNKGYY